MTPAALYKYLMAEQARLQAAMDEIESGPEKESLTGQWAMAQRIIERFGLDKCAGGVH